METSQTNLSLPIVNQPQSITQSYKFANKECKKGISICRCCEDPCVLVSYLGSLFGVNVGVGVGLSYAGCSEAVSALGGAGAGVFSGLIGCTVTQCIQNYTRPCNNLDELHQINCPLRNPERFV
jgi:hypothetical protein